MYLKKLFTVEGPLSAKKLLHSHLLVQNFMHLTSNEYSEFTCSGPCLPFVTKLAFSSIVLNLNVCHLPMARANSYECLGTWTLVPVWAWILFLLLSYLPWANDITSVLQFPHSWNGNNIIKLLNKVFKRMKSYSIHKDYKVLTPSALRPWLTLVIVVILYFDKGFKLRLSHGAWRC